MSPAGHRARSTGTASPAGPRARDIAPGPHLLAALPFAVTSLLACGGATPPDTAHRQPPPEEACPDKQAPSACVTVPTAAPSDSPAPGDAPTASLATSSPRPPDPQCRHGSPPRPPTPPPPPASPHPECAGVLSHPDVAMVQRTIHGRDGCYRRCFEDGLRASPSLTNRVNVKFIVADGSGVVRSSQVVSFEGVTQAVADCVAEEVLDLDFPAPSCGDVTIVYPFNFSPGD